jgi:F0F1-type ATP synthase assembly protein I
MDRSKQQSGDPGHEAKGRAAQGSSAVDPSSLAGMGVQFVVAILLFLFVGKWLDARLGTAPWLLIAGVFLGAGASMYTMYRRVFPPERSGPADKTPSKPPRP